MPRRAPKRDCVNWYLIDTHGDTEAA